jgi:hypothetical protein
MLSQGLPGVGVVSTNYLLLRTGLLSWHWGRILTYVCTSRHFPGDMTFEVARVYHLDVLPSGESLTKLNNFSCIRLEGYNQVSLYKNLDRFIILSLSS